MDNLGKINWFPGHMSKAMRKTAEDVKLCDGVIFVLDARAPFACINDKLTGLFANKPIIYCINKRDTIDSAAEKRIAEKFAEKKLFYVFSDAFSKKDVERIRAACEIALEDRIERDKLKGVKRTLRFMVAGIPNTGKSTLINSLCGRKSAETGDKAGVTRSNKWIKSGGIELLDTPGTMPPNMENQKYARHLAYIGAINDDIFDAEDLALSLIGELKTVAPLCLKEKYGVETSGTPLEIFEGICIKRGFLLKGGEKDFSRGARAVIDDFRKQRLGKICFE
ncbi:MAG TPA: ribosome biogenesis GTPase YlqF [Clostridiales bacterium]|nr:ribosome biogenesis GTPase YlqF [Clostridiales bacterium]